MAQVNIFQADFECDCGSYWTLFSHKVNDIQECPSCGKQFAIYIEVEEIENE